MVLDQLEKGTAKVGDDKLRSAMKEALNKGNVPLPDRMFKKDASVPWGTLNLDYENATVTKASDGSYVVNAVHRGGEKAGFSLTFTPQSLPSAMAKMVWLQDTMGMTCFIISFHAAPLVVQSH